MRMVRLQVSLRLMGSPRRDRRSPAGGRAGCALPGGPRFPAGLARRLLPALRLEGRSIRARHGRLAATVEPGAAARWAGGSRCGVGYGRVRAAGQGGAARAASAAERAASSQCVGMDEQGVVAFLAVAALEADGLEAAAGAEGGEGEGEGQDAFDGDGFLGAALVLRGADGDGLDEAEEAADRDL